MFSKVLICCAWKIDLIMTWFTKFIIKYKYRQNLLHSIISIKNSVYLYFLTALTRTFNDGNFDEIIPECINYNQFFYPFFPNFARTRTLSLSSQIISTCWFLYKINSNDMHISPLKRFIRCLKCYKRVLRLTRVWEPILIKHLYT